MLNFFRVFLNISGGSCSKVENISVLRICNTEKIFTLAKIHSFWEDEIHKIRIHHNDNDNFEEFFTQNLLLYQAMIYYQIDVAM
jgi:hypothetical protein